MYNHIGYLRFKLLVTSDKLKDERIGLKSDEINSVIIILVPTYFVKSIYNS